MQDALQSNGLKTRGRGLMLAAEVGAPALAVCRSVLRRGVVALPAGATSVAVGPPMCITDRQIDASVNLLIQAIEENR